MIKTITAAELLNGRTFDRTIIDIRPAEEYKKGSMDAALNIPEDKLVEYLENPEEADLESGTIGDGKAWEEGVNVGKLLAAIPKDKPVWVLCHTGNKSLYVAELMSDAGFDAGSVEGGYRSFLRLSLSMMVMNEEEVNVFESDIFNIVADVDKSPCYLCARMRRGYLYSHAKELGCNKIALGHHFDDVIETTLMGMLYSGKVETMMPKLHSKNFEGMELIRPMYMVREADIKAWRDYNNLHFIQCACRFTERCATCGGEKGSKRDEMKELIAELRKRCDTIDMNIFNSVHNINLKTVIGYHKGDWTYNFLDDYDKQ